MRRTQRKVVLSYASSCNPRLELARLAPFCTQPSFMCPCYNWYTISNLSKIARRATKIQISVPWANSPRQAAEATLRRTLLQRRRSSEVRWQVAHHTTIATFQDQPASHLDHDLRKVVMVLLESLCHFVATHAGHSEHAHIVCYSAILLQYQPIESWDSCGLRTRDAELRRQPLGTNGM